MSKRSRLLLQAALVLSFLFVTAPAIAYEKGEHLVVAYVCMNEDLMLRIAEEDVANTESAAHMMKISFQQGVCFGSNLPIEVEVKEIILDYKDSEGVNTQLLELVNNEDAQGRRYFVFATTPEKKSY